MLFILDNKPLIHRDLKSDLLHPTDNGKQGRELLDICDVYDLHNLITESTRISSSKESCLDVILTNVTSFALKSGTVDICIIIMLINNNLQQEVHEAENLPNKRKVFLKSSMMRNLTKIYSSFLFMRLTYLMI